ITLRTNSATRRKVVSRSSVVLTTSATSSSNGSTFSWDSGWDVVDCTVAMIAAARCRHFGGTLLYWHMQRRASSPVELTPAAQCTHPADSGTSLHNPAHSPPRTHRES